jgi:hypothetical protein
MLAVFCSLIIEKGFWNIRMHFFFSRVIKHGSVMQMNKNYLEELEVFETLKSVILMYCLPADAVFIFYRFIRKYSMLPLSLVCDLVS